MTDTIIELMKKEHIRIRNELDRFLSLYSKNPKISEEEFTKFKWMLEKHFFIEEKAIFSAFVKDDEVNDIFRLMKEHGEIMDLIREIEDNYPSNIKDTLIELKSSLDNHANFEDLAFYPKLEDLLSTKEKREIIERAKEIIKA